MLKLVEPVSKLLPV